MNTIKASDRAFFLTVVLGLYVMTQLVLSPLLYFGDETYFYNIASSPFNLTAHPIWYYGPVISFLAWPITVIASWPPFISLLTLLLTPLSYISELLGSMHVLVHPLNTNSTMAIQLVSRDLVSIQLTALRLVPIILSTVSLYLIYRLARREVGDYALLFFVPIVVLARLWAGMMWFYWDVFMLFFVILSLYYASSRISYISSTLLVVSKLFIGTLFLLPLIIKKPRLAWSLLILIPTYLIISLLAHNFLFPFQYLSSLYISILSFSDIYHVVNFWIATYTREFIIFLLLTLPSLLLIKRYPAYITFYLLTIGYALIAGLGLSHTTSIVYSGALVFPLVVREIVRRVKHEVV